jgi:hypothetical protein
MSSVKKSTRSARQPQFKVRFAEVSSIEAAQGLTVKAKRQKTILASRTLASDIQIKELWLTDEQRESINALYATNKIIDQLFPMDHDIASQSQMAAASFMATHNLDLDSREDPANRWSIRWVWTRAQGGPEQTKRVLLQW